MKKSFAELKNKFWFQLFLKVGVIFASFVLLLTLCNSVFLKGYYEYINKQDLKSVSAEFEGIDLTDKETVVDIINTIEDEYGFETEIYSKNGRTLYSSSGGQLMDYLLQGNNRLFMNHRPLRAVESEILSNGSVLERAIDSLTDKEYLVFRFSVSDSNTGEIRVQMAQIENSAKTANEFITIIALVVLVVALLWVFWFSKKISKPISEMNVLTKNMANLNFDRKLSPNSNDEIGQLAVSINNLSEKLNVTLRNLNASNAQLRNEIELEHQLDTMRRGFVANVSHELKTPIAIIQGYAEGIKLDINSASKDKYLDVIIDESHRMNKLVLSLLNLSKYESGQIDMNFVDFDICELIKARGDRIFKGKKISVFYDIPESHSVCADPDQIDQVIKSYMENALSHVNENGVIKVSVLNGENNTTTVTVYNSGSRVEEEQMPQIWQSFYRGDKSHNRESGRFGLGLSIVSAIMKLHRENCGVYNTDNGVCFWFTVKNSR
ncbi:MAG: HAMP domain-containing sensor histidine kinase [Acutalibacteraceae bacterium]|nr:HAMP domain-containing sensor histidine kinase [Acutalibacteraceae bacterium]